MNKQFSEIVTATNYLLGVENFAEAVFVFSCLFHFKYLDHFLNLFHICTISNFRNF